MATLVDLIRDHAGRFPAGVAYAALECFLIVLLFVDGIVSFFSNEFARYFGLRVPCLLCTRLDHRLRCRRDTDFYYQESLCDAHALEVSFLAYCHVHRRLACVSRMCKACLLSFTAADERAPSDTYRSLADILGAEFDDAPPPRLPLPPGAGGRCSCCGEELRVRAAYLPRLVRMLSDVGEGPETPTTVRSTAAVDGDAFHPFAAEVPYRELRITSDTEEEDALSSALASDTDGCGVDVDVDGCGGGVATADEQASLLQRPGPNGEETGQVCPASKGRVQANGADWIEPNPVRGPGGGGSTGAPGQANNNDVKSWEASELISTKMRIRVNKPETMADKLSAASSKAPATPSPRLSMLRKRLSMKRHYDLDPASAPLNPGGGGGDGETMLHRLKRQRRVDRKYLIALCAELEQERSASAVAANQAMAMINRLQEEKAAVQMEALQYQRMMEEQAEYDQEALGAMRKRLGKRDRQVAALREALAAFRERFPGDDIGVGGGSGSGSESEGEMVDSYGDMFAGEDDLRRLRSRSSSFTSRKLEPRAGDKGE